MHESLILHLFAACTLQIFDFTTYLHITGADEMTFEVIRMIMTAPDIRHFVSK